MNWTTPTRQPRAQPRAITPKAADDFPLPCPVLRRTTDSARVTSTEASATGVPAWRSVTPITFAHRGGRADAPADALAAFRRALEVGATGLEADARLRHASTLAKAGIAALNLREAEWSLGLVTLAHRFDLLAFAWDAQEYRRIRAVLEMGVDGIYSDHVERLVAAVGEWSAPPPG